MTTPKGKLFQLAKDCNKYNPAKVNNNKNKTVKVAGKHYDKGQSISLSYNLEAYPQSVYDAYRHNEPAAQLSFMDDIEQNESFYVEPFESEETVQIGYEEVENEDKVDKPRMREGDEEREATVAEKKPDKEKTAPGEDVKAVPVTPESESESQPAMKKHKEAEQAESEPEYVQESEGDYEVSNDEFAEDIQAILQGKKVFDPDQKKTVSPGEASPAELAPGKRRSKPPTQQQQEAEMERSMDPAKNEHKIFEKIAQSMRHANSYDLGSIAMEKKFDEMENEIEEAELKTITQSPKEASDDKKEDTGEAKVYEEKRQPVQAEDSGSKEEEAQALLTVENGGRVVGPEQLYPGDILLLTAEKKEATSNNDCYAGAYAGNNELMIAGQDRLLKRKSLSDSLSGQKQAVILRHEATSAKTARSVKENLGQYADPSGQQEPFVKVNYPPVTIHPAVCETLQGKDKAKCKTFKGKVEIGTASNEMFNMPYILVKMLQSSDLNFITTDLKAESPDADIRAKHNGSLQYAGHLKLNSK